MIIIITTIYYTKKLCGSNKTIEDGNSNNTIKDGNNNDNNDNSCYQYQL